jgi:hypothetical protein
MLDPKTTSDVNKLLMKVGLLEDGKLVAKPVDLTLEAIWVKPALLWGKPTLHKNDPGWGATSVVPTRVLVAAWGTQYPPIPDSGILEVTVGYTQSSPVVYLEHRVTGEKDPCVVLCLLVEVKVGGEDRYACVAKQHASVSKGVADLRNVLKLYGVKFPGSDERDNDRDNRRDRDNSRDNRRDRDNDRDNRRDNKR